MSMVDGCALVVCSGANGRVRPLADWADETARDHLPAGVALRSSAARWVDSLRQTASQGLDVLHLPRRGSLEVMRAAAAIRSGGVRR
jgi:hypothetical protein